MSYYSKHAKEYIEETKFCDMTKQYQLFEKYLKGKGRILDIGFGSARDLYYFRSKGYEVYGIDPEKKFVKNAFNLGFEYIYQLKAEKLPFKDLFDGIWACASLLHIRPKKLKNTFKLCCQALKEGGIMYASFKHGKFKGKRNNRYYLDLDEKTIYSYIEKSGLKLLEMQVSNDARLDKQDKWLNVILMKE